MEQPIYRKNLKPVIYVTGDVAGSVESPVYAIFAMNKRFKEINAQDFGSVTPNLEISNLNQPFLDDDAPASTGVLRYRVNSEFVTSAS